MSKLGRVKCHVRGLPTKELGIIDKIKLLTNKLKLEIILEDEKIVIVSNKRRHKIYYKDILEIKYKKFDKKLFLNIFGYIILAYIFYVFYLPMNLIASIYTVYSIIMDLLKTNYEHLTIQLAKKIIFPILRIVLLIILVILIFNMIKNIIKTIKNKGTIIISAKDFPEEIYIGPFSEAKIWYWKIKQAMPAESSKKGKSILILSKIVSLKSKIITKLKNLKR
ncbi:hypothetical protein [Candidatus Pyrohabitans sp.]